MEKQTSVTWAIYEDAQKTQNSPVVRPTAPENQSLNQYFKKIAVDVLILLVLDGKPYVHTETNRV
jgi:hypothetical protein